MSLGFRIVLGSVQAGKLAGVVFVQLAHFAGAACFPGKEEFPRIGT